MFTDNEERIKAIERIKTMISLVGAIPIENAKDEKGKEWENKHLNYDEMEKIGRVYLDNHLYIDTLYNNIMCVVESYGYDEHSINIKYELFSDEVIEKILGYLIQIIKI